jgi:hypothetical protein
VQARKQCLGARKDGDLPDLGVDWGDLGSDIVVVVIVIIIIIIIIAR